MSQTSRIFAATFIAFLIFITMRGELPAYLSIFGVGPDPLGGKSAGGSGSSGGTAGGMVPSNFSDILSSFGGGGGGLGSFGGGGFGSIDPNGTVTTGPV